MKKAAKLTAPNLTVERARDVRQASDVAHMWPKRKKRRGDNDDALAAVRNGAMKPKVRIAPAARAGRTANDDDAMAVFVKQIEDTLRACAEVIDNMPMGKRGYPGSGNSGWPDVVHDYWEAGGHTLTSLPRVIPNDDQIDVAMAFMQQLSQLEPRERNIITWKAFRFSYREIAEQLHCSHTKVATEYRDALLAFAIIIQKSSLQTLQKGAPCSARSK